jgi:chemotaxis response regulator CheB
MCPPAESAVEPGLLRVLLADDDKPFRDAVASALAEVDWIELVGCACDGLEAVRLYSEVDPDVVLMDIAMPRCDGVEATRRIIARDPIARILIVSQADERALAHCMRAGAKACMRKDALALAPLMLALVAMGPRPPPRGDHRDAPGRAPVSDREPEQRASGGRPWPPASFVGCTIPRATWMRPSG